MKLAQAQQIANEWLELMAPYCSKIKIAGSIRREKLEVKDIEIVAIPKPFIDMFGAPAEDTNDLDLYLHMINDERNPFLINKDGPKYKQLNDCNNNIFIDLFLVTPPAQWGKIFALRTGPADYSQWLVTRKAKSGATPSHLRHRDGALWHRDKTLIETPTEQSFFDVLGIDWVEPKLRGEK